MELTSPVPNILLQQPGISQESVFVPQQDLFAQDSADFSSLLILSSVSIVLSPFYPYRR
jgi:hypothetical protein